VEASGWQRAAWESGQDDLPSWEEATWVDQAETFDMACVDLNSYLAMDLESLAWLAGRLGDEQKAGGYREAWRRLRDQMNGFLWNEQRGLYLDRRWTGSWSGRVAAANFLPLLAGVPEPAQARRMLDTLLDPDWFWGDHVLPTISRNDPSFPQQQYWKGTIWPPMNYLVYQGIKRYALDEAAGELARRSVALFLRSWKEYQLCRENYDSRTGEGGGQRYQSWGPLFALIGLEEFLDVTPWAGLTVGSLAPPGETTLRRLRALGRSWTVAMGPAGLRLDADGRTLLASDAPMVLRNLEVGEGSLSCRVHTGSPLVLRIEHPPAPRRVTLDATTLDASSRWIRIPPGAHTLQVGG
jgi:glycogen debranching enzyme